MTARARTGSLLCAALVVCAITGAADAANDAGVRGRVEATTSRWTAGGDLIVTDVVVQTADGRRVTVTTLGGSVDGIGMIVSHHDAALRPDDEVLLVAERHGLRARRVAAHRAAPGTPHAGTPTVGVQRTTRSNRALHHASGCVDFVYDGRGTDRIADDAEWDAVDEALGAWEGASGGLSCGGVVFQRQVMANAPDGRDGINTIRFRDETWCRPATLTEAEVCHSPDAVAVTRVIFVDDPASPRDGEILEVDIDINAVDFALAMDGRAGAIDLASAVAHEIGHALGLDHNCGVETGAWPTGADGTPVASCESVSPELGDATMYFQVAPGTVTMRTPEAADLGGVCSVVGGVCEREVTGGCAATGGGSTTPLVWTLLLGLVGLVRRRR